MLFWLLFGIFILGAVVSVMFKVGDEVNNGALTLGAFVLTIGSVASFIATYEHLQLVLK